MPKPSEPEQPRFLDELVRLCAPLRSALPKESIPCFAHLRIRPTAADGTAGRVRNLLLGWQTLSTAEVSLLHWQTAPLAEVFFANREGEEYELEVGGRVLAGTVLLRSLLDFAAGELVAVQTGTAVWSRRGPQSWVRSGPPAALLQPRGRGAGRTAPPWSRAALDPEQRRAVELPAGRALLVLGEAGCGKTTVAVHRLAALREAAAGRPFRALVLCPAASAGLRSLSAALLARLGAPEVEVQGFDRWAGNQARRAFPHLPERESQEVPAGVVQLKRHPALLPALQELAASRRVARRVGATRADLLHLFGDRARLAPVAQASGAAIAEAAIRQVLEHTRVQFCRTTEEASRHIDADRLVTTDGRRIDEGTPMEDAGSLDAEDYPVLFALSALRGAGLAPTQYDCVVIDEAQEFAPIELLLIGRALRPGGTLIVAGDEAQQVDPSAYFAGFAAALQALGAAEFTTVQLAVSYRCPPAVTALARTLRSDRSGPGSADERPGGAVVRAGFATECHLLTRLGDALRELREADGEASVAVICRTAAAAERLTGLLARSLEARRSRNGDFRFAGPVEVTCVPEVKGLEFDYVVVPDATANVYPDEPGARRALYVAVTRAAQQLLVAWTGTRTSLLPAGEDGRSGEVVRPAAEHGGEEAVGAVFGGPQA